MRHRCINTAGFSLLELVTVLTMISALALTAVPHYQSYISKSRAAACQATRRNIEMDEQEAYLSSNQPRLVIEAKYRCPSGGTMLWLVSAPAAPGYPMVVCSRHGPSTTAPSPPAADALFATDFSSMDGLSPLKGKWALQNDALVNKGGGEHRVVFGDAAWTDYQTAVRATLDKGGGYGIFYRSDGRERISGYCFQFDPGYGKGEFLVRKMVDGKEVGAPLKRVAIAKGYPVYDTAHDITVAVKGDRHVIRIDGETVMDFEDASFSSGAAGLRTWGNTAAAFDSVSVTVPGD